MPISINQTWVEEEKEERERGLREMKNEILFLMNIFHIIQ